MERFGNAIATFEHAIERARQMIKLYDALEALRPSESANDDALRSAYFQTVSSFDFFSHEIAAIEAKYRFSNSIKTRNISLPMEIITIIDVQERLIAADQFIRQANSYKAFVDPAKLAELISCYCDSPWNKIRDRINLLNHSDNIKTAEQLKGQLKNIWRRRNQIAHSADINPSLAGIGLWPIDKSDSEITIKFIEILGSVLPYVFSLPLEGGDLNDLEVN
ncbi:MAG: HEPN domain-containing protein [Beijerinckiaceae bacterium]